MPLSLMAHRFPGTLPELRAIAALERLPEYPTHFAFRNPGREAPAHLPALERRVWEGLDSQPRHLSTVVRNKSGLEALRRLADAGLATIAGFTPSDAMHVLDRQDGWCREAAECGARVLATAERNARALRATASPASICERTYEHVVCESGRLVLAAALAHDPGIDARADQWGVLGDRMIESIVGGRPFSQLVQATIGLARPLIAIGAPVGAYYSEVARRLGATLQIPLHAAVCNAVGAVAGVVTQAVEILVNQPSFKIFRVHDPAGIRDYPDPEPALEHARRASRDLALAAAHRAGAADPHVDTIVTEKLAQVGPGADYLAEAVIRSVATGRPLAGRGAIMHSGT